MLRYFITSKAKRHLLKLFLSDINSSFYTREIARLTHEPLNAVRRELGYLEKTGLLRSHMQGNLKYYAVVKNFPLLQEWQRIILKTPDVSTKKPETKRTPKPPPSQATYQNTDYVPEVEPVVTDSQITPENDIFAHMSDAKSMVETKIETMHDLVDYLRDQLKDLSSIYLAMIHGGAAKMETVPKDGIDLLVIGDIGKDNLLEAVAHVEDETDILIRLLHMTRSDFEYRNARGDPLVRRIWSEKKLIVKGRHQT